MASPPLPSPVVSPPVVQPTIIQVAPTDPPPTVNGPAPPVAVDPYAEARKQALAAEKRADAKAAAEKLKTAKRYGEASRNLQAQIDSLKDAIRREFARGRKQNLRDIDLMLDQNLTMLKESAAARGADFLLDAKDTEQATGNIQEAGFRNLVRERADSMTAILEQGAGETDAVRAMLANARNWHNNASDANRNYFDTLQSVNRGITDLNVDTQASLANAHMTAEGLREEQWQLFYNRRSEAMTELGNQYSSRLNFLQQADELGLKGTKGKQAEAKKNMKKQYAAAANELGKSYEQQPLPEWIDDYEGTARVERRQENTNLASAPIFEGVQRAQGATLRKWAA